MKLLQSKEKTDKLSEDEIKAITAHLLANVSQIKLLFKDDIEKVTLLVKNSQVINLKRKSSESVKIPISEDVLYRRNRMTTLCTLILSGKKENIIII